MADDTSTNKNSDTSSDTGVTGDTNPSPSTPEQVAAGNAAAGVTTASPTSPAESNASPSTDATRAASGVSASDPVEVQTRVSQAINELEHVLVKVQTWTEEGSRDVVDLLSEARNRLGAYIGLEVGDNGLVSPNVPVAPQEPVTEDDSDVDEANTSKDATSNNK